jgi:hypothetical protein
LPQERSDPQTNPDYDEYPTIRQEILQWQTIRLTLVTVSAAAVAAIIGFAVKGLYPWEYFIVSVLLLFFLSVAVLLTGYAGAGNRMMGTYLIVFYEEEGKGWQARMGVIGKLSSKWAEKYTLNTLLTLLYAVLGFASFLLVFVAVPPEGSPAEVLASPPLPSPYMEILYYGLPSLGGLWFAFTLYVLRYHSSPSEYYRKLWRIIKRAEEVGMHRAEVIKFIHVPEKTLRAQIGEKEEKEIKVWDRRKIEEELHKVAPPNKGNKARADRKSW